ncbi:hypothetical protein ACKKBG_A28620 [Auxenochlorella protothecoides x Auxenochlorella symbiontica]
MTDSDTPQESALLTLRLTRGPAAGTELVVQAPAQILGRTRVPRQLQIKDPNVSERHAQIAWDGKTWTVRDLGSSNGTTLNGRALERQGDACPLHNGDVIGFGDETEAAAEVLPAPDESQTVEHYIQAEAARLAEKLRARAEQATNKLRREWATHAKGVFT